MQKVAAYLLERAEELHGPDARKDAGGRARALIEDWLKEKGSPVPTGDGVYSAADGSDAHHRVMTASDGDRSWTMFELTEVTKEGRKFITNLSVTVGHHSVVVFVTMEVGATSTQINYFEVDSRCPKVIRHLLAQHGTWHHGPSRLRILSKVDGFDAGESLAQEIKSSERTIPFVVVSRIAGKPALLDLDEKLAYDLAGVANVYSVDEDASWALTDVLRKSFSCYAGAIRIFWPHISLHDDPYRHQLWTAERLRGIEGDNHSAMDRIRRHLRTIIMRASAASVVRPREIDDIRSASARADYAALKKKASSLEEIEAIADSYAADCDVLRREFTAQTIELDKLRGEVKRLESEKQGLLFHLGQAKQSVDEGTDVKPDPPGQDEVEQPPMPGDVRYYKKKTSAPNYDVMVRVGDCGHNAWQGSAKADKAKKGIARFEGENREWKILQHCGTCTGGGRWKVQW